MNKSEVAIIGAGGHSRSVANLVIDAGFSVLGFFDENVKPGEQILGMDVKPLKDLPENCFIVLAVGDNIKRKEYFQKYSYRIFPEPIIHSSAIICHEVSIGRGSLIFAGVVLNACVQIGENCIINTRCVIEHESKVQSHTHISVGVLIAGRVSIGESCFLGIGSVVSDRIQIGESIIVGAGAVVVKSILDPGIYKGIPAKKKTP